MLGEFLKVPPNVLQEIKERAWGNPNEEICGAILRGLHTPLKNCAADGWRDRSFALDPHDQMGIWKEWNRDGELTIYHSHPIGSARASMTDVQNFVRANEGMSFLIYSISHDKFRAYRKVGGWYIEVSVDATD